MGGGRSLPGFPHPQPGGSYWQDPPHSIAKHRTTADLPSDETFDVIVIGSGITGASVAHKLLARDPTTSIIMLEARTAASAASGRNGRHCRTGYWLLYNRLVEQFGEDDALKVLRLESCNIRDIAAFVKEYDVQNEFCEVETSDTYVTSEEWAKVLEVARSLDEVRTRRPRDIPMTKHVFRGQDSTRRHAGIPSAVGSVAYSAYTQNPYLLVCKMLEMSVEKGMNLQTNTPVLKIYQSKGEWVAETERGSVRAASTVLATNAYTGALHRGLARTRFLQPRQNQVAAMGLGSQISHEPTWLLRRSNGVNDLGTGDYYFYKQDTGHLIYGGGKSHSRNSGQETVDDSFIDSDIATYFSKAPSHLFGELAWGRDGQVFRDWCGIVCYTPDCLPVVGESPQEKGLWMAVGMNGHGMAFAFRSAEALVQMMIHGRSPDWFPAAFDIRRVPDLGLA